MRYHPRMGQLLVRNVPDDAIAALKLRAAGNGRSMEGELREMVKSLTLVRPRLSDFLAEADRLRIETIGRGGTSSEEILREERDAH